MRLTPCGTCNGTVPLLLSKSPSVELMLSQSVSIYLPPCSVFERPLEGKWPDSLRIKHSEGAMFLTVDFCPPHPVITHVIRVKNDEQEECLHRHSRLTVISCKEAKRGKLVTKYPPFKIASQ